VGNGYGWSYQPTSSTGHQFILAITDYFSKWAEAIPLKEVKTSDMIKFIKNHMVYYFVVPRWIVHDNGAQFVSQVFQSSAKSSESKVCLQQHTSLPLTALQKLLTKPLEAANSLAGAFNKTIGKLLKKFASKI